MIVRCLLDRVNGV